MTANLDAVEHARRRWNAGADMLALLVQLGAVPAPA
jgi:hypothetical protein